ncbi:lamin tail domain-containing protein [Patescibacteria group bacterium]|nr:lamin tail domain-containing protein [Patescibacteria group bacterium]MBU0963565.1 lamin tail domain-containing protein [Patescibacteria group bacterium]
MKKILSYFFIVSLVIVFIVILNLPMMAKATSATHLVISEVKLSGGSGMSTDEFVELYNPTETDVSLSSWRLVKKTASGNEYPLVEDFGEQEIKSHSFFLIAHPAGYLGEVQPDVYFSTTNSISSNNTIILLDNESNEIDKAGFGTALDFEGEPFVNPGSNKSAERKAKNDSTDENMTEGGGHYFLGNSEDSQFNSQDFIMRSEPEPQNSLSELEYLDIVVPDLPEPPTDESDDEPTDNIPPSKSDIKSYSGKIIISEIYPNPEGKDDNEFIELENISDQDIDITGWQLGDESSRRYTIKSDDFKSTIITAGSYFIIAKETSSISLNNTSDSAMLYWPDEQLLDSVSYEDCTEEQSYSLIDNEWIWTDDVTPGEKNKFIIQNELPQAFFELETDEFKVNKLISLDASESEDADGDELEFLWDLGNGDQLAGEKIEYSYMSIGKYTVTLLVKDDKGGEDESEQKIEVSDYDYSDQLIINEVLPSCSPSDAECEFIELLNNDDRAINLEGWQLTDSKRYYTFSKDFIIEAGGLLAISREQSKVTLNNSGDLIYLIDPKGDIVNGVEYQKSKKDFSFSFDMSEGKWHWTERPTPGEKNEIIFEVDSSADLELNGESETGEEIEEINNTPLEMIIGEINEAMLGRLLKITGEVESANSRGIYLMDDLGNTLRVYIQKKTGIIQPEVESGDNMTVVGVLDKTSAGLRLLPRTEEDISIAKKSEPSEMKGEVLGATIEKEVIDFPTKDSSKEVKVYLIVSVGALVLAGSIVGWRFYKKKQQKL